MEISASKTFYFLFRIKPRHSHKPINIFVGGSYLSDRGDWTRTKIRWFSIKRTKFDPQL